MIITECRDFEIDLISRSVKGSCKVIWDIFFDYGYEADADGNRGCGKYSVRDCKIEDVTIEGEYYISPSDWLLDKIQNELEFPESIDQ